ncbi:protein jag [Anaerotignum faecicola]|nr:protein jag [Anaerotignum faecicola]
MNEIQKSAKTVELALNELMSELKVSSLDEIDYVVVEEPVKGFLGFGSKNAVVKGSVKYNPEKIAKDFLREMFLSMGIIVNIETSLKDRQVFINLSGPEMGVLIGKRGQTLDSIQYLTNLVVNKGSAPYYGVMVDTENYRQRRKETLESLAFNLAKRVKQSKQKVVLEPMNPYERRIIHSVLQNDRFVTTYSEGEEPYRNVVIDLK